MNETPDARRFAPATARNRDAILAVLKDWLPESGTVLEIAAGSGEHAVHFTPALAGHHWLATDIDPDALASIAAWAAAMPHPRLLAPRRLDVTAAPWPVELDPPTPGVIAIVAINLVHISPWTTTEALIAGAARVLPRDGQLLLYGPYKTAHGHTAPSNEAFDRWLKERNPAWGVRDLGEVVDLARSHGLVHLKTERMPANNLTIVFRRA